jgi:hypothetical protein
MKHKKLTTTVIVLIAAVVTITALIYSREWISKQVFMRSGGKIGAKLNPELQKKYASDLRYTLEKFWQCYDRGLVSREDLNDVMQKMRALRDKDIITDMDIFDFIGYVSRLYTEGINRRQREIFPE